MVRLAVAQKQAPMLVNVWIGQIQGLMEEQILDPGPLNNNFAAALNEHPIFPAAARFLCFRGGGKVGAIDDILS